MAGYNSGRGSDSNQNGGRQVRANQPLVYNHHLMLKEIRDNLKHLRREPEGQTGSEGKETDVKMSYTSNGLPPASHLNQRVNQQRYPTQRNNFGEPRRMSLEPMQGNRTYDESGYSSSSSECSSLSANDLNGGQQFVGNVQNMPFYSEDQIHQGLFPSNFDFVRAMAQNDGYKRINPNASVPQRRDMASSMAAPMQLRPKSPPPYPMAAHKTNYNGSTNHLPMPTRFDHMPIRSDHMPIRSDHMPIRSDHMPMGARSDHMPMATSMTSKVETSKYMQKTALPSGSTTISQAEWKVTTGPEIPTRRRSPAPLVLQDGGALWKTRPYSISQKPTPTSSNQGNYHRNPYSQQPSSQQMATPQFQVQVSLNAPNVAPATINPPNMNPVVSKSSGHSATFRVSVQTSPVSMTTEREVPEPRFSGMHPSGYPTAMARPEAVMDYRESPGSHQYDYRPTMTSSNNGFIQSFSSSKPHPKQHPPPYVPVAHRPPPPSESSQSSFTSHQSNESDMRSVPERTYELRPGMLQEWSHRNVDSVDDMSVSSSGSESHSSTIEEEEFPEFDHASFASQEDDDEASPTTYKNQTGTLLVHFRNRPTLDVNGRDNDENATNGKSDQNRSQRLTTPQAYKFYMEQRVENVFKEHDEREQRRVQLEEEMRKVQLSEEAQSKMRKILNQKETNYIRLKRTKMDPSMFQKLQVIGVGAFGEVCLTKHVQSGSLYAMKILKKAEVLKRNQVAHVKAERDLLAEADNEWVVKLFYSFQDKDNLYFVMEYVPGGDLMSLLIKFGVFTEDMARFYIAELVLAIEYVHKMGFIHRDIKPDNVLIDSDGHIKLTDFGLCTGFRWTHDSKYYQCGTLPRNHSRAPSADLDDGTWAKERNCKCRCGHAVDGKKPLARRHIRQHMRCQAHSLVGTPNYIAPEVLLRIPYTHLCDWWSVGVILYEMLVGQPPFYASNAGETQMKVINWETTLQIPIQANLSSEAENLILQLCNSANQRLGIGGVDEIKNHPFFHGIDWVMIRRTTANYVPHIRHPEDTSNFDPVEPDRPPSDDSASMAEVEEVAKRKHPSHAFYEFTFRRFFTKDQARSSVSNYSSRDETESDENKAPVFV